MMETIAKKKVIGLTGSIGAGKTLVADFLRDMGCLVISADKLAHEVLNDATTIEEIKSAFGFAPLTPEGLVDRKKLADKVFQSEKDIRKLESIVHPKVIARQKEIIDRHRSDSGVKAIVLEIPLLFESGLQKLCEHVILVDADLPLRKQRVGHYRSWPEDEIPRREKFLYSIYLKRALSDGIVYNNSTKDACRQQVEKIFSRIISSESCNQS